MIQPEDMDRILAAWKLSQDAELNTLCTHASKLYVVRLIQSTMVAQAAENILKGKPNG